jgi:hypothetical protein
MHGLTYFAPRKHTRRPLHAAASPEDALSAMYDTRDPRVLYTDVAGAAPPIISSTEFVPAPPTQLRPPPTRQFIDLMGHFIRRPHYRSRPRGRARTVLRASLRLSEETD